MLRCPLARPPLPQARRPLAVPYLRHRPTPLRAWQTDASARVGAAGLQGPVPGQAPGRLLGGLWGLFLVSQKQGARAIHRPSRAPTALCNLQVPDGRDPRRTPGGRLCQGRQGTRPREEGCCVSSAAPDHPGSCAAVCVSPQPPLLLPVRCLPRSTWAPSQTRWPASRAPSAPT